MEISQEELERRLNSPKNLAASLPKSKSSQTPTAKIQPIKPVQKKHLDATTRTVAAILANSGDKKAAIAAQFHINPSQISSAQNSSKLDIKDRVSAGTERVRELALDKLMSALGLMTQDKFEGAQLRELSAVARDMSRVVECTTEKVVNDSRLQIIIQAPAQKTEDHYKTLDV